MGIEALRCPWCGEEMEEIEDNPTMFYCQKCDEYHSLDPDLSVETEPIF